MTTTEPLLQPIGILDGVIEILRERFTELMPAPDYTVVTRPVAFTDPERTVGIYLMTWSPDEGSYVLGQQEPQIQSFFYRIQNLVVAGEEDIGRRLFALDAKIVRAILFRDAELRVRLFGLQEELLGTVDRVKRAVVRGQSFFNNELRGRFVFVATTDLRVEFEATQVS